MNIENEIKFPIQLCKKNGNLNQDALGWSRFPYHRCNLSRKWLRKKKWNYWAIYDDDFFVSFTISDIDYAAVIFCYFWDRKTNQYSEGTILSPFGSGCKMGQLVESDVSFQTKTAKLLFKPTNSGYHLEVDFNNKATGQIKAAIDVYVPEKWESLNVVVPFSKTRFQFTEKLFGVGAAGSVTVNSKTHQFKADTSFAVLDFGRGSWPYQTKWNWANMATRIGKKKEVIGITLGAGWTDNTGATENGILINGRLYKLSSDVVFEFDKNNSMKPWRLFTKDNSAIDLVLKPEFHRHAVSNIGIIASRVDQMLGRFEGVIRVGRNEYKIENASGWAEDHIARW